MGTTQRLSPGVTGEPNWGISNSITAISKIVIEATADTAPSPQRNTVLENRRQHQVKSAVSRLVNSAGGRAKVTGGGSASFGRSGRNVATRIGAFFSDVSQNGLETALQNLGNQLGNLNGVPLREVILRIVQLCSDPSTGMDETAARAACTHLMEQISAQCKDLSEYEAVIQMAFQNDDTATDLLSEYFGYYIFEHISQRFEEKIAQDRGQSISVDTFEQIKLDIIGRVQRLSATQPLLKINWAGAAGFTIIQTIFDNVLSVFS